MPFSIDRVVPWGRSLDEYRAMFALSEGDLTRRSSSRCPRTSCFCTAASSTSTSTSLRCGRCCA